jgi:hypothetical protein
MDEIDVEYHQSTSTVLLLNFRRSHASTSPNSFCPYYTILSGILKGTVTKVLCGLNLNRNYSELLDHSRKINK